MPRCLAALLLLLAAGPAPASPQAALAAALADARQLPEARAYRTRYLSLYNVPAEDLDRAYRVLALQANSLSREPELRQPRRVRADLVAVVLDHYAWDAKVWERTAGVDPYFHFQTREWYAAGYYGTSTWYAAGWYRVWRPAFWLDADQRCELERRTGSKAPLLRADWWFVQTARQVDHNGKQHGIGYYDWLGGIKKRADFERLGRLSEKDSIALGKEMRAVVKELASGVAQKDRQIVRLQALTGPYWLTLDTDDNSDGNTATGNLAPGEFRHKLEEGYIALPNLLWATYAGNAAGEAQPTAPDTIGPNDATLRQGRDGRIHARFAAR